VTVFPSVTSPSRGLLTMTTTSRSRVLLIAVLGLAFLVLLAPRPAAAQITYGTLSNFDVFNDTGQETHGFEIELEGISSSDVSYLFGEPYERYGNPTVVGYPGGVYVRYQSAYDAGSGTFLQSTPMAPNPVTPTDGHACWNGGTADYQTSGCEHFGIGLNASPTRTVYRWLVADPAHPGALQPAGTKVSIPAPVWNVSPPLAGDPNPQPIVGAVIAAPEPDGHAFGDAIWVKVYKTESPDPVELQHLLTDDPGVPQEPSQTETEWYFLQAEVGHGNPAAELANEAQMAEGSKSVTRRYEIYAYSGVYDAESHEARPISDPTPDPADLGNYLGAQMAAVNIADAPPPPPPALVFAPSSLASGEVGVPYSSSLVTGGMGAFTFDVTAGALPGGLTAQPDGALAGTPTASGSFPFTVAVTDQAPQTASGSFDLTVAAAVAVTTSSLPAMTRQKPYSATLAASAGIAPFTWSISSGSLPAGLTLNGATGVISGTPTRKAAAATATFRVQDALGATASRTLTIAIAKGGKPKP